MHNWNYNNATFIGMVSITTWAQRVQERQNNIPNNQPNEVFIPPNIPIPQPPKVLVKGVLQQKLINSQVKMSLFELLKQS